jgi:mannobiose 2-epimerase
MAIGTEIISKFSQELEAEASSILEYWMNNTIDEQNGGFFGSIDHCNNPVPGAPKGIVLNSRILWTFSAAFNKTSREEYLRIANRAFTYILVHFADVEYGGVFWSLSGENKVLETKKQVYGNAFCIYGMAEYYKATSDNKALEFAQDLFQKIEKNCFDQELGGYIEAFDRSWHPLDDLRLSEKDENEKKTMNTHLHIIEAYANLYSCWQHPILYDRIIHLLEVFKLYFIDPVTHHLKLFMDENWISRSSLVSYGHDIEASWLLLECAETIRNESFVGMYTQLSISLAEAALCGLDKDGALWYENDMEKNKLITEKHSWPQAEAMIGFINMWQITGDERWLARSMTTWDWIKQNLKDDKCGEWYWGINNDGSIMKKEKAGFWKCPYHSVRACMEVVKRIGVNEIKEKNSL